MFPLKVFAVASFAAIIALMVFGLSYGLGNRPKPSDLAMTDSWGVKHPMLDFIGSVEGLKAGQQVWVNGSDIVTYQDCNAIPGFAFCWKARSSKRDILLTKHSDGSLTVRAPFNVDGIGSGSVVKMPYSELPKEMKKIILPIVSISREPRK